MFFAFVYLQSNMKKRNICPKLQFFSISFTSKKLAFKELSFRSAPLEWRMVPFGVRGLRREWFEKMDT